MPIALIVNLLLLVVQPASSSIACTSSAGACNEEGQDHQQDDEPLLQAVSLLQHKVDVHSAASNASVLYDHPTWLKDCKSIYLDVGTNIGVQIRKLYEPALYSKPDQKGNSAAKLLQLLERNFGSPEERCAPASESGLCALGFEPNPELRPRLQALQEVYTSKGWNVHIYPFAASDAEGQLQFDVPPANGDGGKGTQWSGTLHSDQHERHGHGLDTDGIARSVNVRAINFSDFLQSLPKEARIPLMKMDIEGAEWRVLAMMERSNQLCAELLPHAFIESHPFGDNSTWNDGKTYGSIQRRLLRQECEPLKMLELDDESFLDDVDHCFHNADYGMSTFGKHSSCHALQKSSATTSKMASFTLTSVLLTSALFLTSALDSCQ